MCGRRRPFLGICSGMEPELKRAPNETHYTCMHYIYLGDVYFSLVVKELIVSASIHTHHHVKGTLQYIVTLTIFSTAGDCLPTALSPANASLLISVNEDILCSDLCKVYHHITTPDGLEKLLLFVLTTVCSSLPYTNLFTTLHDPYNMDDTYITSVHHL